MPKPAIVIKKQNKKQTKQLFPKMFLFFFLTTVPQHTGAP